MNFLGVSQYGQMTAGSYIHWSPRYCPRTTITLLNAARMHLNLPPERDLAGITFVIQAWRHVGAQAKAAVISGAACIVAEMNEHAAIKRYEQGWLTISRVTSTSQLI